MSNSRCVCAQREYLLRRCEIAAATQGKMRSFSILKKKQETMASPFVDKDKASIPKMGIRIRRFINAATVVRHPTVKLSRDFRCL
jgi:hypothetical protein